MLEAEALLENSNLKHYICEKVAEMLTMKNCFFYLKLCKLFSLKDLLDVLYNLFLQCYLKRFNLIVFYKLNYKDVLNLISSSHLQIDSELEVFNAIVDWINYKISERNIYFYELLKVVRLPLLTKEIIVNVVQAHPLCSNSSKCKIIINKALEIKRNKSQFLTNILLQNRNYCGNIDSKEVMFIVGKNRDTSMCSITCRIGSSEINEIKRTSYMNGLRKVNASIVIGSKIYCIGSRDFNCYINDSFDVYCRRTDRWDSLDEPPILGVEFCACSFMGKIYVFGGCCSKRNSVYDPESNSWKQLANMIKYRYESSCTVFQGKCIVVGGNEEARKCSSKSVETYDHYLDKWSLLPHMQAGRILPGLLPRGNKLYVIGGNRNTIEVYDSLTKQFNFIAPKLNYVFLFLAKTYLIPCGSNVFVFRNFLDLNFDNDETNVSIPTYNIVENKWHTTVKKFSDPPRNFYYSIVTLQNYLK